MLAHQESTVGFGRLSLRVEPTPATAVFANLVPLGVLPHPSLEAVGTIPRLSALTNLDEKSHCRTSSKQTERLLARYANLSIAERLQYRQIILWERLRPILTDRRAPDEAGALSSHRDRDGLCRRESLQILRPRRTLRSS